MSSVIVPIIVGVLCALIFGVIGFVFGGEHRRKTSEKRNRFCNSAGNQNYK